MAKIVITHKVEDVEKWLKGKADRIKHITHMGGTNVVDHVAADGSKTVAITADTQDPKAMVTALANPPEEVSAAMKEHGVVPPVAVYTEG